MTTNYSHYSPVEKFHAHLDVCEKCAKHTFDLCATGAELLEKAATWNLGNLLTRMVR